MLCLAETSDCVVVKRCWYIDNTIDSTSPHAIFRSEDHEQGDLESAVRNAANGAYLSWPNEAGVSDTSSTLSTELEHPIIRKYGIQAHH